MRIWSALLECPSTSGEIRAALWCNRPSLWRMHSLNWNTAFVCVRETHIFELRHKLNFMSKKNQSKKSKCREQYLNHVRPITWTNDNYLPQQWLHPTTREQRLKSKICSFKRELVFFKPRHFVPFWEGNSTFTKLFLCNSDELMHRETETQKSKIH